MTTIDKTIRRINGNTAAIGVITMPVHNEMIRAAIALQVAALEWGDDETHVQSEARQAIIGMREAINVIQHSLAKMARETEKRRHS